MRHEVSEALLKLHLYITNDLAIPIDLIAHLASEGYIIEDIIEDYSL